MAIKLTSRSRSAGYTIVELLVVITILGLLATILLVRNRIAQERSRDAKRIADMEALRLALEMYNDQYGHSPGPTAESVPAVGEMIGVGNAIDEALKPFMGGYVPKDPYYDTDNSFYYAYDPQHWNDTDPGPGCTNTEMKAVIGFTKFEDTGRAPDRQTDCGGNMNLDTADYNRVAPEMGP